MGESLFSNLAYGRPVSPDSFNQMQDLRLIDLNLIYTIKEKILPINGYVSKITETISPLSQDVDPETGLTVTPYKFTYYDWVYYNPDSSNPALSGLITQPILSASGSLAYVDYQNGTVFYSGIKTDSVTATYYYYSVYVQDGFPDFGDDIKAWQDIRIPLISVDYSRRRPEPYAIGGGYKDDRYFTIDVIANSDAQRDDIVDLLETSLRYTYYDTTNYSYGFPIKFNGDKNLIFDRGAATRWKALRFKDTQSMVIRNPTEEEKFRHRAVITLNIETVGTG